MRQRKSILYATVFSMTTLCLAACAGKPEGVAVTPKSTLPSGSVVLIDPTTDDGMLPAISESLSKGAVTVYTLDGPGAPLPVQSSAPVLSPGLETVPLGITTPVSLRAPEGMVGGARDPRVTVYGIDGRPVNVAREPEILTPMPALPPPVSDKIMPLESPFNEKGEVVAKPRNETVLGTGSRAVSVDNLLETEAAPLSKPATTTKKKRPPKGMTY